MRKLFTIVGLVAATFSFAQNVVFSKVVKTLENTDKNLISVTAPLDNAEFLAEIEVLGFTNDDAALYKQVYAKAKEVGANVLEWQPFISIDDKPQKLDPHHYKLNLYYKEGITANAQSTNIMIFGAATKDVKIALNDKKITLPARTYIVYPLKSNEVLDLRIGSFLGSRIKVSGSTAADQFYFQLSGNKVGAGEASLNLKGGDILGVDPSFGEFLKLIYKRISFVK